MGSRPSKKELLQILTLQPNHICCSNLSLFLTQFGSILILGVGGFFCEWEAFDGGWPSIFYMCGILSAVFCVIWLLTVYDSPSQHPRITDREIKYIQANTDNHCKSSKVSCCSDFSINEIMIAQFGVPGAFLRTCMTLHECAVRHIAEK